MTEREPTLATDGSPLLPRLEALLGDRTRAERALGPDGVEALCVAMAIGPDEEPVPGWIFVALGEDDPDAPMAPEVVSLLERFRAETAARVQDASFAPLLYTLRRGRPDYMSWCRGFLVGVELSEAGWYESADPEEVDELLFPLHVLAGELTDDERARYSPADWRRLVLDSEAGFQATLRRIRDYWAIVRHPPQTIRHATPKAGRNDPCPCASGRKYKHCCGR